MKKKISPYLVVSIVLAAALLTLPPSLQTPNDCDTTDVLPASAEVRNPDGRSYIGFDLNGQNLTFGILSPGAMAKRSAFAEYTKAATVYVWPEGGLSSWLIISPKKFDLDPSQKQEVSFTLLVPDTAKEGKYNSMVVFCYQDKLE